ncbi:MAG: hypothetical protein HKN60_01915 [Rhizobiales bacterium]|nr:hypothetical protein [Hyphomicrobiales bacterium]
MSRGLKIALTGAAVLGLAALVVMSRLLGLWSVERHSGFFAPVWDDRGGIYFIQRDTFGVTWGMGWEHFSPPASVYVISDEFSLRLLPKGSAAADVLQTWDSSPLVGRVTKHYRRRIFNTIGAKVEPRIDGVKFAVRMSIPRVPRSESWSLTGEWSQGKPSDAVWGEKWADGMGVADEVLRDGVELIAVAGPEAFPAGVLAVRADGSYDVLRKTARFDGYYPVGVPPLRLEQQSRRKLIERGRTFRKTHAELVAKYTAQGMREGAASLKAYDDMEELGLLNKSPRLVAWRRDGGGDNLPVFDIPPDYFKVGLFTDIAEAIKMPGQEVKTGTGDYLKYYDDDVGARLKKWRGKGNREFIVTTGGERYHMEVRTFPPKNE